MKIVADISAPSVSVRINPDGLGAAFENPVVKEYVNVNPYMGAYEFTPNDDEQTVPVQNLRMTQNLVIKAIPSNYGHIAWNGSYLTVS